jgi:hypothetical protein
MDVHGAPRGKTEDQWLEIAEHLTAKLSLLTASTVWIGPYWGSVGGGRVSFGCRLRSRQPLPGVESDAWEAALCVTGDEEATWSDVYAFPFLGGSAVDTRGRISDRGPEAEIDQLRWFQFADGDWRDRGWTYPDGAGEWSWVKRPGDVYVETIECESSAAPYGRDEELRVQVRVRRRPIDSSPGSRAVFSLVSAARGHHRVAPWTRRLPRSGSHHLVEVPQPALTGGGISLDLRAWPVEGGWQPGTYRLALRAQVRDRSGAWESSISPPFKITVGDAVGGR